MHISIYAFDKMSNKCGLVKDSGCAFFCVKKPYDIILTARTEIDLGWHLEFLFQRTKTIVLISRDQSQIHVLQSL